MDREEVIKQNNYYRYAHEQMLAECKKANCCNNDAVRKVTDHVNQNMGPDDSRPKR